MEKPNYKKTQDLLFDSVNEDSKSIDDRIREEFQESKDKYTLYEKYGQPFKNVMIITAIGRAMTPAVPENQKSAQLDFIKHCQFIKYYILKDESLIYADYSGNRYEINRIDKIVDDNDLKIKLKTDAKENDCHRGSWNLMNHLDKIVDKKIVTSFITGATDESKYLHTWIEFDEEGKTMVADYTINALIDKELYYKLKDVEREGLCSINQVDFEADREIIKSYIDSKQIQLRQYLYFRDEIMNELQKKGELINE